MDKERAMGLDRRDFLKGVALAGALAAGAGLAGCGTGGAKTAGAESAPTEATGITADEVKEADIVVVGAGSAGLTAAVEAGERGLNVIVLEKMGTVGGNGLFTDGICAAGSDLQKEKGIDFPFKDIITAELAVSSYETNALLWKKFIEASGANIAWLQSHGIEFSDVNDYHGYGKVQSFHAWKGERGSRDNFADPMFKAAQAVSAQFMMEAPVEELVIEDGAVKGVYAKVGKDKYTQINAKGVILATGGYLDNEEKMTELGYETGSYVKGGVPGHDGDGLRMAVAAGGVDVSKDHCFIDTSIFYDLADLSNPISFLGEGVGGPLWVNQDGERYTNENCAGELQAYTTHTIRSQKKSFALVDKSVAEKYNVLDFLDTNVTEDETGTKFKADTLDQLAEKAGIDPKNLTATVARYNELCAAGSDEDFDKPAEFMNAIETGPFYLLQQTTKTLTSVGAIRTNGSMQVVDSSGQAIPGLYAAGTDGCELYFRNYSLSVPGSCNGNNVFSARTAVAHIADNLL